MDVNFLCNFNATGIGRHCENAFYGMLRNRRQGIVPLYVDYTRKSSVQRLLTEPRNREGVTLLFWRFPTDVLREMPGRKIGWLVFESDRIPPQWLEQMLALDELWIPSAWGREALLAHGIPPGKVHVVPEGVDPTCYAPAPQCHEGFVFLIVGKYEKRKSIDEAIEAFCEEFPRSRYPDVTFVIKADHPTFPNRVAALRARCASDPRLQVVSGLFSDEEMAALYNRADAFVFPSKAEGFGLPCIEALACGVPVITTDYGGQTAFLECVQGLFRPVQYEIVPLEDPDFEHFYGAEFGATPYGSWAEPDPASLRAAMRDVYESRESWLNRALLASERIRDRFSWDRAAQTAIEMILRAA